MQLNENLILENLLEFNTLQDLNKFYSHLKKFISYTLNRIEEVNLNDLPEIFQNAYLEHQNTIKLWQEIKLQMNQKGLNPESGKDLIDFLLEQGVYIPESKIDLLSIEPVNVLWIYGYPIFVLNGETEYASLGTNIALEIQARTVPIVILNKWLINQSSISQNLQNLKPANGSIDEDVHEPQRFQSTVLHEHYHYIYDLIIKSLDPEYFVNHSLSYLIQKGKNQGSQDLATFYRDYAEPYADSAFLNELIATLSVNDVQSYYGLFSSNSAIDANSAASLLNLSIYGYIDQLFDTSEQSSKDLIEKLFKIHKKYRIKLLITISKASKFARYAMMYSNLFEDINGKLIAILITSKNIDEALIKIKKVFFLDLQDSTRYLLWELLKNRELKVDAFVLKFSQEEIKLILESNDASSKICNMVLDKLNIMNLNLKNIDFRSGLYRFMKSDLVSDRRVGWLANYKESDNFIRQEEIEIQMEQNLLKIFSEIKNYNYGIVQSLKSIANIGSIVYKGIFYKFSVEQVQYLFTATVADIQLRLLEILKEIMPTKEYIDFVLDLEDIGLALKSLELISVIDDLNLEKPSNITTRKLESGWNFLSKFMNKESLALALFESASNESIELTTVNSILVILFKDDAELKLKDGYSIGLNYIQLEIENMVIDFPTIILQKKDESKKVDYVRKFNYENFIENYSDLIVNLLAKDLNFTPNSDEELLILKTFFNKTIQISNLEDLFNLKISEDPEYNEQAMAQVRRFNLILLKLDSLKLNFKKLSLSNNIYNEKSLVSLFRIFLYLAKSLDEFEYYIDLYISKTDSLSGNIN